MSQWVCALMVIRPRCFPVEPKKPKLKSNDPRGGRVGSARPMPVLQTDGVVVLPMMVIVIGQNQSKGTFLHGPNLRSRHIWIETCREHQSYRFLSIYFIFPSFWSWTSALLSFPSLFPSEVQAASAALAAQPKGVDLEWGTEGGTDWGLSPMCFFACKKREKMWFLGGP